MSTFERNIEPEIQTELTNREILSEGRPRREAGDTGATGNISFADMASRTTYSIMVTNYGHASQNINKGIAGGEFFENKNEDGTTGKLFETLNGFRFPEGDGTYRNTIAGGGVGIRPICGIKSIVMEFLNANGVRKATVNWSAPSLDSLEEFKDFLRVGTAVALQFGWVWPTRNDITVDNTTFIRVDKETNQIIVDQTILTNPYDGIVASKGNMDALGGFVSNFSSKLRDDGGFDCETIITGFGISFLEDVGSMESGAEVTLRLQDEVRNALQDYEGNYSDVINTLGDSLRDAGIFSEEDENSLVEAIAYNDLFHAVLNLDSICKEIMGIESEKQEQEEINFVDDLASRFERGEITQEEFEQGLDNDGNDDLTAQSGGGVERTDSGFGDAVEGMFKIDSTAANMFSISKEVKITPHNQRWNKNYKYKEGDIITDSDVYVRWGWLEDNVFSKYLAIVDDSNDVLLDFRSIQDFQNPIISNYVSYNKEMKPKDFSKVFWASSNWSFNVADFDDEVNQKPEKETKLGGILKYNHRTGEVFTIGRMVDLVNKLNQKLSSFREFQDNQNANYGRIRNMFVNVSAVQEAFGFDTAIRGNLNNSGFLKEKPPTKTLKSAIDTLIGYLQDSLYNVPDLMLESEAARYSIIDKTIEASGNTKAYTTKTDGGQIINNGLFKFESFSKNSIVKNQNLEFNIPDKLGSAAFLNAGGSLSTKGNTEEEKFMKITKADGFPANSFLPNPIKNPKSGVDKANPNRILKNQDNDKFVYYGGLVELKDWKKIPLKSSNDKNISSKEFVGPPVPKEGMYIDAITDEIISITKNEDGSHTSVTVDEASMYLIDQSRENNWLECIKLDSKYEPLLKKIFTQTGVSTTQSVRDPINEWANLSLEIDGIGGLRPRTMLNVSYLPRKYNLEIFDSNKVSLGPCFYFNITSLTQKIDDSGWTTSFDTIMRINDVAFDYAAETGVFNTTNAINSLSRQFKGQKPESLVDKLKKILEPLAKAKQKFDEFMADAEEYQLDLQNASSNLDSNRAAPYTEAYQRYKGKKDIEEIGDFADSELDNMLIGLDELELFDVDESGDVVGFETEVYEDEDKEKFAGVRGLMQFFREGAQAVGTAGQVATIPLSVLYDSVKDGLFVEDPNAKKVENLADGDSSTQSAGNKELDIPTAENIQQQNDRLSTFSQIKNLIKQQATNVANVANNVGQQLQTEAGLLAGSGNTPQRQLETIKIRADKVLDRLGLSRLPDGSVQELLKDVDVFVSTGEVKTSLATGKFARVYSGRGTANTFNFENEDVPISFSLEEVEGTPFNSEQEALNSISDENSIFVEIVKNNLIIEAEGFYNT